MLKKKLLIIIFFSIGFGLLAQNEVQRSRWYIGFSGGAAFGDIANTSFSYRLSDSPGLQVGGVFGYNLTKNLSLQFEAVFERRIFRMERYVNGFKLSDSSEYVCWDCFYGFDVSYTSDYISLPILLNYHRGTERFGIHIQGGLFYSLLLVNNYDGYEEFYFDPVGANNFIPDYVPGMYRAIYSGPSTNLINTYDIGAILGLAGKYKLTQNIDLMIEARLTLGYAGIFENPQMILLNYKGYVVRSGFVYFFQF
jgi:hypothetical protein